jgi:hypothetical protein
MLDKDQVLNFKNFSIREKLESDYLTVYHRTGKYSSGVRSVDCPNGTVTPDDFAKGFKVGGGAYHGAGIYTTQELEDQMTDTMRGTYGPIIIEYKVKNTDKFIILDYDAQKKLKSIKPKEGDTGQKAYGLKAQLRKILGGKYNKIYNYNKEAIDNWDKELESKGGNGQRNADIGNNLIRLPGILGNIDGFVYTGFVDGNCVLIYDSGLAQAVRWTEVPGPEWPKTDEIKWNIIKKATNKDTVKGYVFKSEKSGILFNSGKSGDKVSIVLEGGKDKEFVKIIGKVPSDKEGYGVGISDDLAKKIGFKEGNNITVGWKGNVFRKTKLQNQIDYADQFLSGFDILEVILSKDETDDAASDYEKLVKFKNQDFILDSLLFSGEKKVKKYRSQILAFIKESFGGIDSDKFNGTIGGRTLTVLTWIYGPQYVKKLLMGDSDKIDSKTIIAFIFTDLGIGADENKNGSDLLNIIDKMDRISSEQVSSFSDEEKIELYKKNKKVIFTFFVNGEFLSKSGFNYSPSIIGSALRKVQEGVVPAFNKKYPTLKPEIESLFSEIPNLTEKDLEYIVKFVTDKKQLKSMLSKSTESSSVFDRMFNKFLKKMGIASDDNSPISDSYNHNRVLLFEDLEQSGEEIEDIFSYEEIVDYLCRGIRLVEAKLVGSSITDDVKEEILKKSPRIRETLKNWLNRDNEKDESITTSDSEYDVYDVENNYKQFLNYNFSDPSYKVLIDFHLKNFNKEIFAKNFWNKYRCLDFVRQSMPDDYGTKFAPEFMTNEFRKEVYSKFTDVYKNLRDDVIEILIDICDDTLRQAMKEGLAKTSLFKDIFESDSYDQLKFKMLDFFTIYYDSPGIIKKIYKILKNHKDWSRSYELDSIFVAIEKFQGLVPEGKTEKNESSLTIIPFKYFINESDLYKSTLKGGESAKNSFLVKLFYILFSLDKTKLNKMFASPEEMFDFCKAGKLSEMFITRTKEYKKKLEELEKSKKESELEASKQRDEEYDKRQNHLTQIFSDGEMLKIIQHLNNSKLLFSLNKSYPLLSQDDLDTYPNNYFKAGSKSIKPWYSMIDILRLATLYGVDKGKKSIWLDTLEYMEGDLKEYIKDGAIVSTKFPNAKTIEELVNLYAKSLQFIIPLTSGVFFKVKSFVDKII